MTNDSVHKVCSEPYIHEKADDYDKRERSRSWSGASSVSTISVTHPQKEKHDIECLNIAPALACEVGITPNLSRVPSMIDWTPPETHGLENSDRIIPLYYMTNKNMKGKMLYLNYFEIILDDIRNCRELNTHQLKYLSSCSCEEKMTVIREFNKLPPFVKEVLS